MNLKKYNLTAVHTDCGPIFMKNGQTFFHSLLLMSSQLVDFDEESLDFLGEEIKAIYGLDVNDKDSLQEKEIVTEYEDTHKFRVWADSVRQYLSSNDKEKAYAFSRILEHLVDKNGFFKYSSKEISLNILGPEVNEFDIVLSTENNLYFYAKQNSKC